MPQHRLATPGDTGGLLFLINCSMASVTEQYKMQIEAHELLKGLYSSSNDFTNITGQANGLNDLIFALSGIMIGLSFVMMILRHC